MRYLIVRRRIRIGLLFLLSVLVFISVLPLVYKKIFFYDRDFITENIPYKAYKFSDYFIYPEYGKKVFSDIRFLNDGYILSNIKIDQVALKDTVVSASLFIKGQLIKDDSGGVIGFSGRLFSRKITLNSIPFETVQMAFNIIDDVLEIESLRLGKSYELKGRIGLVEPFQVLLRLNIIRADIRDLAKIAKAKNPDTALGIMNGVFDIKGTLPDLFSSGVLESRHGRVGPVSYDSATIKFEGFGPIINIVDSRVMQGRSALTMEGYIDLRNIAKGGFLGGIRVKSDLKTIVWDDWDITKEGIDKLSMTKDISDNFRVGFKTMTRDPLTTYYDRENPEEMSLEYQMGEENLQMKLKENEGFFGIGRNIKS